MNLNFYKFSSSDNLNLVFLENRNISVLIPGTEKAKHSAIFLDLLLGKANCFFNQNIKSKNKDRQSFPVARYTPVSNSVFSEADLVMVLGSKKHFKQYEESSIEIILTFTPY